MENNNLKKKITELRKKGYNNNQATYIAKSEEKNNTKYAQQADMKSFGNINPVFEQGQMPMDTYMNRDYDQYGFNNNVNMPQSSSRPQLQSSIIPTNIGKPQESSIVMPSTEKVRTDEDITRKEKRALRDMDTSYLTEEESKKRNSLLGYNDQQANNGRENYMQLYGGYNLEGALAAAGQGFGEKNYWKAGIGTGLTLLKSARTFGLGYASGKENRRFGEEYNNKVYGEDPTMNYPYQQGGKISNSQMMTGQFIADEGQGNINLENNEFVKRNNGMVQQVVGEPHLKGGKIADGVDANLEEGDKVLSNYIKLPAKTIKELKENYSLNLKKGATFADAQKQFDRKIGIKKETENLETLIEKMGESEYLKDETTKRLNQSVFSKQIAEQNEKLQTLKQPQSMFFEELFAMQERVPKKGDGTQLYDKNGKEVTEHKNDEYAQQGGEINTLASKYGISTERAKELVQLAMQQGGEMMGEEQQMMQQPQEQGGQEEQMMMFIAQALQQGVPPEQIMQQLVQGGVPQEVAQQMIQAVMEQGQNQMQQPQEQGGQEEQMMMEQQMQSQEQSQMMQYGGQVKRYAQEAIFDEGYLQVNAPIKGGRYNPKFIPQGQKNKEWFPDSQEAADYFLENASTLAKVNPKFKKEFEQIEKDIKAAKTPKERFDVLTKSQGQRQQAFWDFAPKELREYVALGYAPTQIELQNTYNALSPELKTKFEGLLSEQNIDFKGGKIKGGYYMAKGNWNEKNPLYKFINEDIKTQDPKLFESVVSGRINDKQWDRRMENFQTLEFNSTKERDNYAKEQGFEKINGLWVDPKNRNNIIKPVVYRVKKVTPYGLKKYNENKNLGEYEGYKNFGEDGVYEKWVTEGVPPTPKQPINSKNPNITPGKNLELVDDRTRNVIPWLPQNINMTPSPLTPIAKEQIYLPRIESLKNTPEPMLAEAERMRQTDVDRIQRSGLTPQQQEALMAQGLASSQMAANDAISKVENFNTQKQFQTDQFNIGQRSKEDITNAQYRQDYQEKVLGGLANQERDWKNYFTQGNMQNRQNFLDIENTNLLNADKEKYQYMIGRGVQFNPNTATAGTVSLPNISDMTNEQIEAYKVLFPNQINALQKSRTA